jgi:uncharacterized protein DUF1203
MPAFRLVGLPDAVFAPYFEMSAAQLAQVGARRMMADADSGYPCRVSLVDADVGDELLLLPFEHQAELSPYRASGPVFVRRGVRRAVLAAGTLPPYVTCRLMSVRAYDAAHLMVDAAVCDGAQVREPIERLLADDQVAYLHLHNAMRGCYSCRVERA